MALAELATRPGLDGGSALDRLRTMARQRPILAGGLRTALARHESAPAHELETWSGAILTLAYVNAGPGALLSAFRIAATLPRRGETASLERAAAGLGAAAQVCRFAGAAATRATLEARYDLAGRLAMPAAGPEAGWWRALAALAREEPSAVSTAARTSGRVIVICGTDGFEAFVGAGLRATTDRAKRLDFFALRDPAAQRVLDRLSGQVTFAMLRQQLRAYVAALWGAPYRLHEAPPINPDAPRRATISPGLVHVPDVLPGVARDVAAALYRATVAHATAHLALGGPHWDPGTLKPVQIAIAGLVEDARIEALAMRRFPGLFRLWAPFHTAEPSHLKTAPMILARLARGLFDSAYADDDAIVAKGRKMFAEEPDLEDPGLSRRIGSILGNDIGQMRIQFNAKLFVVEPAYRDDNFGLWELPPPPPDADQQALDLPIEAARVERKPDDGAKSAPDDPQDGARDGAGRARPVAPEDDGIVVAHYPEWDRAAGIERPDWTTIREVEAPLGSTAALDAALDADVGLRRRVERLVRAARVGRPTRLKRQPDGLDLDLDAAIDAARAMRAGEIPDERIHQRKVMRTRDLAMLILIDISESTRDRVPAVGQRVIDVEKVAVGMLAQAMGAANDTFALRAFSSDGRARVRYLRLKDFDQTFDATARARLAGLQPGLSTRLGAALRHAGHELAPIAATRKLVIVLTDGTPSDIDVSDPAELVEDARRAALALHAAGIDTFGITLDPSGVGAGPAVFGQANHMPVRRIEELPSRLSALYFRVARR